MDGGNMTMGFYKADEGSLLYAPNAVYGPGFTLTKERPEETAGGWRWFDTPEAASEALGVPLPPAEPEQQVEA